MFVNDAILSSAEIDSIQSNMDAGKQELDSAISDINAVIAEFENDSVVQTFFAAGNFGQEEENKLIKIKEILNKELSNITGNLIPTTENYLNGQRQLNESGER